MNWWKKQPGFVKWIVALAILGVAAVAYASTASWPFTTASDYTLSNSNISVTGGLAKLLALDFTDDDNTSTGFGGGTHSNTAWDGTNNWVAISGGASGTSGITGKAMKTGTFTSRIFDAGASVPWNGTIAWTPNRPEYKELPNSSATESAYTTGNIDASGNVLLYHMNEASGSCTTIADSSSSANNGTNTSGTCGAAGVFDGGTGNGGAMTFVTGSKVERAITGSLNMTGTTLSVCAWVKAAQIFTGTSWQYIAYTYTGTKFEFGIYNANSTAASMKIRWKPKTTTTNEVTTAAISSGIWYHTCGVYDGTNNIVYLDGVATSKALTGSLTSTTGGYRVGGNGSTGYWDGQLDEVSVWNVALTATQVLDMYKRGAVRHRFQVRSCANADCSDGTWMGPSGSATAYYEEQDTNTAGLPSFTLSGVADNRYFQYDDLMEEDDSTINTLDPYTPELKSVVLGPTHYDAGNPTAINNTAQTYSSLSAFSQTLGAGNAGTLQYQVSPDGGTTWKWYTGGAWTTTTAAYSESNSASTINTNIGSLGGSSFKFKAFLHSANGTQAVELDQVDLTYSSGGGGRTRRLFLTE